MEEKNRTKCVLYDVGQILQNEKTVCQYQGHYFTCNVIIKCNDSINRNEYGKGKILASSNLKD